MAKKKTRTPPLPRRVQAPKARTGTSEGGLPNRKLLYGIAGSGILALVVVVVVIVLAGGTTSNAKAAVTALTAAGCQYKHYPALPRSHYLTLTPNPPPKWNSFPPTSGRHYYQWVLWGIYTQPVREIQAVHNLEHGGLIIQYGSRVPKSDVQKITAFYQSDPNAVLVAPLPALGDKIALTTWTQWAECTHFSQKAFTKFKQVFRYHGPESPVYPKSALQPGM